MKFEKRKFEALNTMVSTKQLCSRHISSTRNDGLVILSIVSNQHFDLKETNSTLIFGNPLLALNYGF